MKWSAAEDRVVRSAVQKYGTNDWPRVASLLPRRSATECRQRWKLHLDVSLNSGEWTQTEDTELQLLAKQFPNLWASIALKMGSRTAEQCYNRYTSLQSQISTLKNPPGGVEEEGISRSVETDDIESELSGSESSEDLVDENRMLREAETRLAANSGRKYKRKHRERLESLQSFNKQVEKHRKQGTAITVKPVSILPVRGLDLENRVMKKTIPHTSSKSKRGRKERISLPKPDLTHDPRPEQRPPSANSQQLKLKLQLQKLDADLNQQE